MNEMMKKPFDMKSIASDAVMSLLMPAIEKIFWRAKRQHLHIVVMDPRIKPWDGILFEKAILSEYSFGNKEEWEHPYDKIARSKARQSWREQQSNIITQAVAPATLQPGDTVHNGGFYYCGLVVGTSGIEWEYDMMISGWVAVTIQQLVQRGLQCFKAENPGDNFLPA